MTNSAPEPSETRQPSEQELRIRRHIRDTTNDEWVAALVAFGVIGAILFWALRGRNRNFAFVDPNRSDRVETNYDLEYSDKEETFLFGLPKEEKGKGFSFDTGITTERPQANLRARRPSLIPVPLNTPKPEPVVEEPKPPVTQPTDVTPKHWSFPFIEQLVANKSIPGKIEEENTFDPDKPVNRGEMASLLSAAFSDFPNKNIPPEQKVFKDVNSNGKIVPDINKAVDIGFMKGYVDKGESENNTFTYRFRPQQKIPRYQVLVTLATGLGLSPDRDSEATLEKSKEIIKQYGGNDKIPDWAVNQVADALQNGIAIKRPESGNDPSDTLDLNRDATRAEVAAMIHQALVNKGKLKPVESKFIIKKQ